ncbi:class I SAM-dependent methyltransferase [Gellertiella hungarica]|uniref:Cyclopropane fatty-acyl-phospholipid synthase-like methyltransferase n=1 Tax=Gellertiella hungarica TaxID=1572859 RepID=A0A7W6J2N3_9HYPH|nr:class I SAM-dependent methyltransferase [Gellertiella hungarica]MBB4062871.1 cyclopropane fatty-acyl-phospholipid synthase-like methyltransferase [Gellertiella hungarica]
MLSARLKAVVEALPLRKGMKVLEIGCSTGAMARHMAECIEDGFVLGIDRSATAIARAREMGTPDAALSRLAYRHASAADFSLPAGDDRFDLAVAIRVGAFDGRHVEEGMRSLPRILAALKPGAPFLIDHGDGLVDVRLMDWARPLGLSGQTDPEKAGSGKTGSGHR